MKVIVEINGRQALPVRAIPLLTDWRVFSADIAAKILSGDSEHWPSFEGLHAYRLLPDGNTEQISPRWWSWVVNELAAVDEEVSANQPSINIGRQQWRRESLAQLPAGVFVWCDEFEVAHVAEFGPDSMRARSNPCEFDPTTRALDFNPQPPPDIAPQHLVLEGFSPTGNVSATPAPASVHPPSPPIATSSASDTPAWTVTKRQRFKGYSLPLYRLLATAHRDGNPCPTALDVVEEWRTNTPAEIAKVLSDSIDYYDSKGNTKAANLEAIRKAIKRMTSAR